MSTDADDLLTVSQVCRRLPGARGAKHVSPATVSRWVVNGCPGRDGTRVRLVATRAGGRWLIRPSDLEVFFAALATPAPAPQANRTEGREASAKRAERAAQELRRRGA